MGALIFAVIIVGLLALAVFGFVDEAKRKKKLRKINADYDARMKTIENPKITPHPVIDYGIDMSAMQDQIKAAELKMFKKISRPQIYGELETAWQQGDYDIARNILQKIAYTMVDTNVSAAEKAEFTQLMTRFAQDDPFYNDVMKRLLPFIQANPGMVQSHIYKGEPDHIKEQMRYVLYFANELGHIQRVKKGNSYKLYPPGVEIDASTK